MIKNLAHLEGVNWDLRERLPQFSGIYYVLWSGAVLYIGQARNIKKRWENHPVSKIIERLFGDVIIAWLRLPVSLLDEREAEQISLYQPPINKFPESKRGTPHVKIPDSPTYGRFLKKLIDLMAEHEERDEILKRNDIPRLHLYNVINDNRRTSGGRRFHTPIEWMVKLTRDSGNFSMIKQVATDCKCHVLTPEDIQGLKALLSESAPDPLRVMSILHKIINGAER